ncbi:MAG: hypothetical protein HY690_06945 [Chloroflexi bacterium]|nr:hypothetical protein [Chloroflexota bacterium]
MADQQGVAAGFERVQVVPFEEALQQTTRGLAFYRKSTNTATFTNGFEHWALTTNGLLYWTGDSIDPPGVAAPSPAPTPAPAATPQPTPATPAPTGAHPSQAEIAATLRDEVAVVFAALGVSDIEAVERRAFQSPYDQFLLRRFDEGVVRTELAYLQHDLSGHFPAYALWLRLNAARDWPLLP